MARYTTSRRLGAEFLGTALLLATIIGSGIMGAKLSSGNAALALLGNALPTGAMLVVLITIFEPVSGAHFNPAVSGVAWLRREICLRLMLLYVAAQICGGVAGVLTAHVMFDLPLMQLAHTERAGTGQWFAECVATFGLLLTIVGTQHAKSQAVAVNVGLYITAAYWFTSSTSFANPAVTIARAFSDTFAGIRLADVAAFLVAQLSGALIGMLMAGWLFRPEPSTLQKEFPAA